MRQELSLLSQWLICLWQISAKDTWRCIRHVVASGPAVHKAIEHTWEHHKHVPQTKQYVCPMEESTCTYFGRIQSHRLVIPVEEWSTCFIIHARIKAFSFDCHSAPHLVCSNKQGKEKKPTKNWICAFKKQLQKRPKQLKQDLLFSMWVDNNMLKASSRKDIIYFSCLLTI